MRDERDSLLDILDQIARIERFTQGGQEVFMNNDETQYAVTHAYVIIGEAVKNLPETLLQKQPAMDWRQLKGFRDFLIHSYHKVNAALIWEAVLDLPNLKTAIQALFAEVDDGL